MMTFENGVRGVYEGSSTAAVGLNDWTSEYVRVDCELGTAILNNREIEIFTRASLSRQRSREGQGQKIQLLTQPKWLNTWLIEKFCRWLDGGPEMETNVAANVHASALVFASIESQRIRRRGEDRQFPARQREMTTVAVIGGGLVGSATAVWLIADGFDVTVFERDPEGRPASTGNAGFITLPEISPLARPGTLASVPGWMIDPLGPLTLRARDLAALTPWLARFVAIRRARARSSAPRRRSASS